jgi:hypothetical protein
MAAYSTSATDILRNNLKPSFGAHEKFVFRHGWLKKGVDAVAADPLVFTHDEALVELGVGKNMVRSIRFWCLATGMIEETDLVGRVRLLELTKLGGRLLPYGGWDPYLEDGGTLWLLHWQLATNTTRALVWHQTFCTYYESEFSKAQLGRFIAKQLDRQGIATTEAMVEREVDTCLRTYAGTLVRAGGPGLLEESFDCPLVELDLLRLNPVEGLYRFSIGPKVSLPAAVVGFALLQYFRRLDIVQRTVAVDDCVYGSGSPGQVFKLDENSMVEYLEALEPLTDGAVRLQETAGLRQLYLHHIEPHQFKAYAFRLLANYYGRHAD